ncbi:MAG TPA: MucR family transcriptional regulator [Lichenihabitans sp.]|jgi:predicted transcriptional regulator|nr:MucR family transcriptional regulator [Lichenihabitans sp.]
MTDSDQDLNLMEMAAEIVSAYVRNNSVPAGELPQLLQSVHGSLGSIVNGPKSEPVKEPQQPKVPIKKSVTDDFIVCLEDGKRFKSLKRHLHSEHGLSPQEYRAKWALPKDYPMVAPAYASARSSLAKTLGLGRKAPSATAEPTEASSAATQQAGDTAAKKPRRAAKAPVA